MSARGGVPTPTELRNMSRGGYLPTYPLGIVERRHRNIPSLAKERNPRRAKFTVDLAYSRSAMLYRPGGKYSIKGRQIFYFKNM